MLGGVREKAFNYWRDYFQLEYSQKAYLSNLCLSVSSVQLGSLGGRASSHTFQYSAVSSTVSQGGGRKEMSLKD